MQNSKGLLEIGNLEVIDRGTAGDNTNVGTTVVSYENLNLNPHLLSEVEALFNENSKSLMANNEKALMKLFQTDTENKYDDEKKVNNDVLQTELNKTAIETNSVLVQDENELEVSTEEKTQENSVLLNNDSSPEIFLDQPQDLSLNNDEEEQDISCILSQISRKELSPIYIENLKPLSIPKTYKLVDNPFVDKVSVPNYTNYELTQYPSYSLFVCGTCNLRIYGDYIVTNGSPFHSVCRFPFIETNIEQQIMIRLFDMTEEEILLRTVNTKYRAPSNLAVIPELCGYCEESISGAFRVANEKHYHLHCLPCPDCSNRLGKYAKEYEGKLMCLDCSREKEKKAIEEDQKKRKQQEEKAVRHICHKCKQPIESTEKVFRKYPYHTTCYSCSVCKTSLVQKEAVRSGDDLICTDCVRKQAYGVLL